MGSPSTQTNPPTPAHTQAPTKLSPQGFGVGSRVLSPWPLAVPLVLLLVPLIDHSSNRYLYPH